MALIYGHQKEKTKKLWFDYTSVGYINVMWYEQCKLYYWIKVKKL